MNDNQGDELMSTQEKIQILTQHLRRLWPKYDEDLDQFINSKELIVRLINHTFKNAQLQSDLNEILQEKDLDELIFEESKGVDPRLIRDANNRSDP